VPNPVQPQLQGYRILGVYKVLLKHACEFKTAPDYRRSLSMSRQGFERLKVDAAARAESMFDEQVGDPIEVPRWWIGGRRVPMPDGAPAWLRDRDVKTVRVLSDDQVLPSTATDGQAAVDRSRLPRRN
jgi:hypothetical protein